MLAYIDVAGDVVAHIDGLVGGFVAGLPQEGELGPTLIGLESDIAAQYIENRGKQQPSQLEGLVGGCIGNYDANIHRFVTVSTCSTQEVAQKGAQSKVQMSFADTAPVAPVQVDSSQQIGSQIEVGTRSPFDTTEVLNRITCSHFADAVQTNDDGTCFQKEQATPTSIKSEFKLTEAIYSPSEQHAVLQQLTKLRPDEVCAPVQNTFDVQHDSITLVKIPLAEEFQYQPPSINLVTTFVSGDSVDLSANFTMTVPHTRYEYADSHHIGVAHSAFCGTWDQATFSDTKNCSIIEETKQPERGITPWIDYPRPDPDPDPPSGITIVVPVQEVYSMENIITVTLADDITPVQLGDIRLSLDADSHSWQFSGALLDPEEVVLVKPLADGSAVELHITINGYVWHVLVEKPVTTRNFDGSSIALSGRGISGLLAKPYRQPSSLNIGTLQTVQQIADLLLPLGWTNIWSTVTWNVDGGAYSHSDKTPIEALAQIARDIGAIIVPSRNTQQLEFKPRYPVLPWNFAATIVDVAIPDAAILQMTEEPTSSFQANGVYIHGMDIGGELAFCRLNGTAGDKLASTVSNALMTDPIGLRALGERILAGQFEQPKIKSIDTFMDGTVMPLIDIGTFVGMTVDGVETKAIVNGVSISANFGEVSQSLEFGESTTNSWVAFQDILPKDPMLVATLSSTDGVTSLMALVDGGVVRVRGTGTVGDQYYIRSGEIVSAAPNQTLTEIVL